MTRETDTFGFIVTDVARLVRTEMDRRIAEAGLGLTPAEARTLAHAARAGAVRQSVLAERIGVEAMTVSGALDRLERVGLIERRTDPDDRRAKRVAITDRGRETLRGMEPVSAGLRRDAASGIDPAEWEALNALLARVRANLVACRAAASREDPA